MLEEDAGLVDLTVDIASAYVAINQVATASLADLIRSVHGSLNDLGNPKPAEALKPLAPAVPIRKSITPDFMICMEDGLKFKSLTWHLRSAFGLMPDQCREKWGLAKDYPMVALNYSAQRSELAKALGLGQMRQKARSAPPPAVTKGRRTKQQWAISACGLIDLWLIAWRAVPVDEAYRHLQVIAHYSPTP